jgi:hypothetical protein
MRRHPLLLGLTLLALSGTAALAQDAMPVLQTVTVGSLSYSIDPFYVVACYWIKDDPGGRIWDGTQVVQEGGSATVQCFHRDTAGAMTAWPAFATTNDGILEHTELGQPLYGMPQEVQP